MKVTATKPGFFGGKFRNIGDSFLIHEVQVQNKAGTGVDKVATKEATEAQFSTNWMKKA